MAGKKRSKPYRHLGWRRFRYGSSFLIWMGIIWGTIGLYLTTTPSIYTSTFSLILPGSGVSTSVNLESIGQASSFASSAFSSNAVSPTQTYKRLIRADRIRIAAARRLGKQMVDIPRPGVTLVDQTGLIQVQVNGATASEARDHAQAILTVFQADLDRLRRDEMLSREQSAGGAIDDYRHAVTATRKKIDVLQQQTGFLSVEQYADQVADCDDLRVQVQLISTELQEKSAYVATLENTLGLKADQAAQVLALYADSEYRSLSEDVTRNGTLLSEAHAQYGPRHPRYTTAQAQFNQSRAALNGLVARRVGTATRKVAEGLGSESDRSVIMADLVRGEAERRGLSARFDTLNAQLQADQARLETLAPLAAQLEDLHRDFRVSEAVFASAIARGQSSKSDIYGSYPLVQVLENPSLADGPTSPRKLIAVVGGLAATLCVLIAGLLGWMRHRLLAWLTNEGATGEAGADRANGAI